MGGEIRKGLELGVQVLGTGGRRGRRQVDERQGQPDPGVLGAGSSWALLGVARVLIFAGEAGTSGQGVQSDCCCAYF